MHTHIQYKVIASLRPWGAWPFRPSIRPCRRPWRIGSTFPGRWRPALTGGRTKNHGFFTVKMVKPGIFRWKKGCFKRWKTSKSTDSMKILWWYGDIFNLRKKLGLVIQWRVEFFNIFDGHNFNGKTMGSWNRRHWAIWAMAFLHGVLRGLWCR